MNYLVQQLNSTQIIVAVVLTACAFMIVPRANAAELTVVAEAEPLFNISSLVPGVTLAKTLSVTNTSGDNQVVYVAAQNAVDGGLTTGVNLSFSSGGTVYFSDTFSQFFSNSGVNLGNVAPGETRSYVVTMTMPVNTPSSFQGTSLGFDLGIGFAGGDIITTVSGGGGRGGGSGTRITASTNDLRDGVGGANLVGVNDRPIPQILGDQVSIIPVGAPNTGGSATSDTKIAMDFSVIGLLTLFTALLLSFRYRVY